MDIYWCKVMHPDPGICPYAELFYPESYLCNHPDRREHEYNKR